MCNRDEDHDDIERLIVGFAEAMNVLTLDA